MKLACPELAEVVEAEDGRGNDRKESCKRSLPSGLFPELHDRVTEEELK